MSRSWLRGKGQQLRAEEKPWFMAVNLNEYGEAIVMMNEKLNVLIEAEVGEDVGQMLPSQDGANWTLSSSIEDFRP